MFGILGVSFGRILGKNSRLCEFANEQPPGANLWTVRTSSSCELKVHAKIYICKLVKISKLWDEDQVRAKFKFTRSISSHHLPVSENGNF